MALLLSPMVAAADPLAQLSTLEKQLKAEENKQSTIDSARRKAKREITALKVRLAELAAGLKQRQSRLNAAQAEQDRVAEDLARMQRELNLQAGSAAELTKALLKLGLKNPQLSHLNVIRANRGVRGMAVLAATNKQLASRSQSLRIRLGEITTTMAKLEQTRLTRQRLQTELSDDRRRLQRMLGRKHKLKASIDKDFEAAKRRIAKLAAKAANLRDLIASLEFFKSLGEAAAPTKALLLPAEGSLADGYGTSKGIRIAAPAQSRVIAPWGGEVLFADRFRDYGNMVIISHGGGFHSIISGLGRVDVVPGAQLIKGEPIGAIGSGPLYFEWRRSGNPINPLPWLAEKPQKKG